MPQAQTVGTPSPGGPGDRVRALREAYGRLGGLELVRVVIEKEFPGRIALVSAFGAESAVLLDLVAQVDPATPVIFLETGKLFSETLAYRDALAARLGLADVRSVRPDAAAIAGHDPDGNLWQRRPDACCRLRKVLPLETALSGFEAWITGRKRFHGGDRSHLPTIEALDGWIKINPLAGWSHAEVDAAITARNLPRHPLAMEGYLSIGCQPCTRKSAPSESIRAGRWAGTEKTECGIHLAKWAREERLRGTRAGAIPFTSEATRG